MMELVSWYLDSVSAFFVSLASGGLFKLLLLWLLFSCIFRRGRRWGRHRHGRCCRCRCSHCGCKCGHCPCGAGEDEDDGDDIVVEADVVVE